MASQFFEYEGVRVDLSKVDRFYVLESNLTSPCFLKTGIYVGVPGAESKRFGQALESYRESLKPKYQFKDGWYICNVGSALKPANVLRYIKNDLAYSADTCRQMRPALYQSVTMVDHQPPPLFVNDSE